jgi:hypothetical protein
LFPFIAAYQWPPITAGYRTSSVGRSCLTARVMSSARCSPGCQATLLFTAPAPPPDHHRAVKQELAGAAEAEGRLQTIGPLFVVVMLSYGASMFSVNARESEACPRSSSGAGVPAVLFVTSGSRS